MSNVFLNLNKMNFYNIKSVSINFVFENIFKNEIFLVVSENKPECVICSFNSKDKCFYVTRMCNLSRERFKSLCESKLKTYIFNSNFCDNSIIQDVRTLEDDKKQLLSNDLFKCNVDEFLWYTFSQKRLLTTRDNIIENYQNYDVVLVTTRPSSSNIMTEINNIKFYWTTVKNISAETLGSFLMTQYQTYESWICITEEGVTNSLVKEVAASYLKLLQTNQSDHCGHVKFTYLNDKFWVKI